jgi:zinc protease
VLYKKLGLVAAALALSISGLATAADAPTPKDIVAKYIEATGGKAKWEALKSRSAKGTLNVVAMGMTGSLTQYVQGDDAKMIMALDGFGEFLNGMKDGKVWSSNMMEGDKVMEGAEAEAAKQQFDLQQWLHWEKYYPKAETVGEEAVGDKTAWKVVFTPAEGEALTHWFDKESGLLIQTFGPGLGGPSTTTYKDYKEVGGLTVAHSQAMEGANGPVEMTFESIEFNTDIDAANFEVPAGIAALMNPAPAAN